MIEEIQEEADNNELFSQSYLISLMNFKNY